MSKQEAQDLFAYANKQKRFLMEAQKSVFLPVTQDLKKIIQTKALGKLQQVNMCSSFPYPTSSWMLDPTQGGVIYGSASYTLEYLDFLLEPTNTTVEAMGFQEKDTACDRVSINIKMDHVLWYYEDHTSGERVDVYDTCVSFMKKLMLHIPDENYRIIRYIGGYATKKKKLANLIRKMVHSSAAWILKKTSTYRQYRIDTTGIDPLLCSCGCEMKFVDCYFPPGIQEKINEKWKFPKIKYDSLQVY